MTSFIEGQSIKIFSPILVTLLGIITELSTSLSAKATCLMRLTPSEMIIEIRVGEYSIPSISITLFPRP